MKLIKFSKPGCMPCIHLSRYLERVLPEKYPEVELIEINIQDDPDMVAMWQLRGVPTVILISDMNNQEINRLVGYNTPADFKQFIDPHMVMVSDTENDVSYETN